MILVPSERVALGGQLVFPPFTQLGWDQNAPKLGQVQPDEVAKAGHILQYGRPLYVLISDFVLLCPLADSQMGLTEGLPTRRTPPPRQTEVVWNADVQSF
jgi:hypothetical protein